MGAQNDEWSGDQISPPSESLLPLGHILVDLDCNH